MPQKTNPLSKKTEQFPESEKSKTLLILVKTKMLCLSI